MPSVGQENLETVMIDFFGALRRGDFEAAAGLLDPEVSWQGLREEWVCYGREEVVDTFRWGLQQRREIDALEFTRGGERGVFGSRGPNIGPEEEPLGHFVQAARAAGCSWAEIGSRLGVSKQAAQQRFVAVAPTGEAWPPGLDEGAGAAFASAAGEARALGHYYVGPEHLLLALLAQPEELAARALGALGVTAEAVRARVVERLPPSQPRPGGSLGVAPQTKRQLELARTLAKRLGHRCARTEHLLLAAVSPSLG